ncbi:hypothetical protein G7K_0621-t1 [Saitoella complicata NRRL Y-17804]|uniref:Uncharacterized protein n=1 Tax=Saitoella complicata (strain BCRC 22490 / CBS 7301 / JCM 7358 / NBRC 10748 / NRRL Y-17804) TaxID=698492 RepID=A0A0E9NAH2_SAICN|nr:hypothetical protein G7K_0621-t1 [Saitoella complicata NRRL Y-17804]
MGCILSRSIDDPHGIALMSILITPRSTASPRTIGIHNPRSFHALQICDVSGRASPNLKSATPPRNCSTLQDPQKGP